MCGPMFYLLKVKVRHAAPYLSTALKMPDGAAVCVMVTSVAGRLTIHKLCRQVNKMSSELLLF